ncbi:hypothetical protein BJV78DRAFT_356633 [Lactifluus subvellereus]|nr:hypothetical protein BJV78DRAFT_356633 [Lactifluus subvellereus]
MLDIGNLGQVVNGGRVSVDRRLQKVTVLIYFFYFLSFIRSESGFFPHIRLSFVFAITASLPLHKPTSIVCVTKSATSSALILAQVMAIRVFGIVILSFAFTEHVGRWL